MTHERPMSHHPKRDNAPDDPQLQIMLTLSLAIEHISTALYELQVAMDDLRKVADITEREHNDGR